jgi:hypothetical protein
LCFVSVERIVLNIDYIVELAEVGVKVIVALSDLNRKAVKCLVLIFFQLFAELFNLSALFLKHFV